MIHMTLATFRASTTSMQKHQNIHRVVQNSQKMPRKWPTRFKNASLHEFRNKPNANEYRVNRKTRQIRIVKEIEEFRACKWRDIDMSEQLLNDSDVVTGFKVMGCKTMAQRIDRCLWGIS